VRCNKALIRKNKEEISPANTKKTGSNSEFLESKAGID